MRPYCVCIAKIELFSSPFFSIIILLHGSNRRVVQSHTSPFLKNLNDSVILNMNFYIPQWLPSYHTPLQSSYIIAFWSTYTKRSDELTAIGVILFYQSYENIFGIIRAHWIDRGTHSQSIAVEWITQRSSGFGSFYSRRHPRMHSAQQSVCRGRCREQSNPAACPMEFPGADALTEKLEYDFLAFWLSHRGESGPLSQWHARTPLRSKSLNRTELPHTSTKTEILMIRSRLQQHA